MEDFIGAHFFQLSSSIKGIELVEQEPVALNGSFLVVGLKMVFEQADSFFYGHGAPPYSFQKVFGGATLCNFNEDNSTRITGRNKNPLIRVLEVTYKTSPRINHES